MKTVGLLLTLALLSGCAVGYPTETTKTVTETATRTITPAPDPDCRAAAEAFQKATYRTARLALAAMRGNYVYLDTAIPEAKRLAQRGEALLDDCDA